MADLSNLLGDVYGDPGGQPSGDDVPDHDAAVTPERAPEAPAWADESRLDEAFADWRPEPLEPAVAKVTTSAPLDDDLAAALSAALADAPRPAAPPARFSHVDAIEPVEPPVVDVATLEPIVPAVDLEAVEAVFVPPTPIDGPAAEPVPGEEKRRSFSLSLPRRGRAEKPAAAATAVAPERVFAEPAAVPAGRAWQRGDDDILPAGAGGRSFRLR